MEALRYLAHLFSARPKDSYYSPNEDYFDRLSSAFCEFQAYKEVLDRNRSLDFHPTTVRINPFENTSKAAVIEKFGKPSKNFQSCLPKGNILFYRTTIGGYRVKCDFHFSDEQLVMFRYTFTYFNKTGKDNIHNILLQKYFDFNTPFSANPYRYRDTQGNELFINDFTEFIVTYIVNMPVLNGFVTDKMAWLEENRATERFKQQLELFEKL